MSDKKIQGAPEIDDEFVEFSSFPDLDCKPAPTPLDNPTKEKAIEVFNDAAEVLKPVIEQVKEKVRNSGLSAKDIGKAETEFQGRGENDDHLVRGIVNVVGNMNEREDD